jgi:hypothetical protein
MKTAAEPAVWSVRWPLALAGALRKLHFASQGHTDAETTTCHGPYVYRQPNDRRPPDVPLLNTPANGGTHRTTRSTGHPPALIWPSLLTGQYCPNHHTGGNHVVHQKTYQQGTEIVQKEEKGN